MSSRTKTPAVTPLSDRQIAQQNRAVDAFLIERDDALHERVRVAAKRGIITTPAKLLKNDRHGERHGKGVCMPPRDSRARAAKFDARNRETLVTVDESQIADCFKNTAKPKVWGRLDWLEQEENAFGQDPLDALEIVEAYEAAGGDAAEAARDAAIEAENERQRKVALGLIHPRDRKRVEAFLAGVPVAQIAADEGVSQQCVYEALARSEARIVVLLAYRQKCLIWSAGGRGERPELPEIDNGASAEQLDIFGFSGDAEVQS